uniref:Uncharacterized protein n=1 Tax=Arundo donax TaxID=35708 RepID=A0A0A9G4D6_ARUDO
MKGRCTYVCVIVWLDVQNLHKQLKLDRRRRRIAPICSVQAEHEIFRLTATL